MKHGTFVDLVSQSCGVPKKTVALIARNLKSAGLLTTGARGVNAPEMVVMDLARMVIALCATDRPAEVVDATKRFCAARCAKRTEFEVEGEVLATAEEGDILEDVLAGFLGMPANALVLFPLFFAVRETQAVAELTFQDTRVFFYEKQDESEARDAWSVRGVRTTRDISSHSLQEMALPFALENADGATWEDMVAEDRVQRLAHDQIFGGSNE